jgi:hypothetical protein
LFFASSRLQSTSFNSYLRPSSSVARPCSLILSRSPVSIKSRRLVPSKKYSYEAQLELYSQWLRTQSSCESTSSSLLAVVVSVNLA